MKFLLALAILGLLACGGDAAVDTAVATASPSPAATPTPAPTPAQGPGGVDYREGRELFEQGCSSDGYDDKQCKQAVSKLEKAIQADPNLKEAYLTLALAYWNQSYGAASNKTQDALNRKAKDVLQKLTSIDPNYAEAYFELSVRSDDPAEQQKLLERTVGLNPQHPQAHRYLAQILLDQGRVDEAVEQYKQHLQVSPDHSPEEGARHVNFALALEQAGRTHDAAEVLQKTLLMTAGANASEYERCLLFEHVDLNRYAGFAQLRAGVERLRPYCTNFEHRDRAVQLQQQGKTDEAVAELQLQLQQNPSYRDAYFLLEQIYLKRGDKLKALSVVKKYFETEKDPAERCRAFPLVHLPTYQSLDPLFTGKLKQECEKRPTR
jgi:tetratricopeptide (TPR) repeat protein